MKLVNGEPVYDTNWNLSGNMVETTIVLLITKPGTVPGEPALGPPYLEHGWFEDIEIKIGGTVVYAHTGPITTDMNWHGGLGTQWRIASTGWADGGNIDIEVSATFYLLMRNPDDTTFWHVDDFSETYPFKAYNKMQMLGTELNGAGQATSDDRAATLGILNAAIDNLGTHSKSPTSALAALSVGKFPSLGGIISNTVFVDATHGAADSYMDSFGWTTDVFADPQYTNKQILFATDVLPTSQAKTLQQPKYNLAVFCACEALAGESPVVAYEMESAKARASAGFAADVDIWAQEVATGLEVPVSKHAEVLFASLGQGMTLSSAVAEANSKIRVRYNQSGGASGFQVMLIKFAGSARMKHVWISPLELVNLVGVYPDVNVIQLPILPPAGGGPGGGGSGGGGN